jgi:hypothetical protein
MTRIFMQVQKIFLREISSEMERTRYGWVLNYGYGIIHDGLKRGTPGRNRTGGVVGGDLHINKQ